MIRLLEKYQQSWRDFSSDKNKILTLIVVFFLMLVSLYGKKEFLLFNESRQASSLADPVLSLFQPLDISNYIFFLTYFSILLGVFTCFTKPWRTIHLFLAIISFVIVRVTTMYLFPLSPPINIIPLEDPFLNCTFYNKAPFVKDLFFSGHTSSVFLLYFLTKGIKVVSPLLFVLSFAVGISLMLQHVHYTIDVLAAFPFTYFIYWISSNILVKLSK